MSPVNDEEPTAETNALLDRVAANTRRAVGASDRMPVRVLVLFVVAVACMVTAPLPINVVGGTAIVLLALDTTLHRRQ